GLGLWRECATNGSNYKLAIFNPECWESLPRRAPPPPPSPPLVPRPPPFQLAPAPRRPKPRPPDAAGARSIEGRAAPNAGVRLAVGPPGVRLQARTPSVRCERSPATAAQPPRRQPEPLVRACGPSRR